ncbi:MAG: DUF2157 domain-containing protein [Candidatus Pacebacteria bacterium]|nr:DUF2157 domain-containing protein [Candidatus Paceibacterota bacterium]
MKKRDIILLADRWQASGVISQEQAAYIKNDAEQYISEASGGKFITGLMYMGAMALIGGVLLVIASHWMDFPDGFKSLIALLMPVVPLVFAYWQFFVKQEETVLARVANVAGVSLIGGSIALIEQIYHLQSSIQGMLWLWALLAIPFTFVFRRAENVLLSVILVGAALFATLVEFFDQSDLDEGTALLLISIATLTYSYAMYAVGSGLRYVEAWRSGGRILRIGGGAIAVVTLFITTFEEYAQMVMGYRDYQEEQAMMLSIVFNLTFIGFMVFALFRSVKYEEYNFAFSVVRVAALYLFVKYVTLFSSMLDTGVFLIVGGLLFTFGARFLEKNKGKLVVFMRESRESSQMNSSNNNQTYG